ncbi:F-box associated interaction domain [Arabidopsis thaliana x Arabidopsis arenosa]|uniref:F-box associated interaction domain n=1 Tax=Arabidopsis thaliana x Arabidopsis arenosa TaxID=1240361 RepID=A0A8T2BIW7_9BRAS|nr:F-box associated interaction domain [Arabidopsis thaliana x Arabidopsis arenosa]
MKHVSGFIEKAEELKSNDVDEIICFSVNEPFVMKAWGKTCAENKHVKFVADGSGEYTHLLGLELDLKDKGLGVRSRRFALLLDNLKVIVANVESGGGQGPLFQLETMSMTMSNLPKDLVEEIVSRVPLKFMRSVRLTCKKWNTLFKSRSFMKMHIDKEEAEERELGQKRMIVMKDYNVYLMGIVVGETPSTKTLGKLTCLDDSEQIKISEVFHCEGLLLCILKDDNTKIVVWNPYLGQTRWIQTRKYYRAGGWKGRDIYTYALGYENNSENRSCRSPKILRFIDDFKLRPENPVLRYEIYDFVSDLWTTLDVSPHWRIMSQRGLSLKGNTYWGAVERNDYAPISHIICFDFTRERFGPLLPLPFSAWGAEFASLSSVREEKIAALFQTSETFKFEIWITTKIEAENVSWSRFFTMDISYLDSKLSYKSFFIDEEKKAAVVFEKEGKNRCHLTHDTINIIGEDGCLMKLELGEPTDKNCWPLVCPYVPSVVQIKLHKGGKRKEQSD